MLKLVSCSQQKKNCTNVSWVKLEEKERMISFQKIESIFILTLRVRATQHHATLEQSILNLKASFSSFYCVKLRLVSESCAKWRVWKIWKILYCFYIEVLNIFVCFSLHLDFRELEEINNNKTKKEKELLFNFIYEVGSCLAYNIILLKREKKASICKWKWIFSRSLRIIFWCWWREEDGDDDDVESGIERKIYDLFLFLFIFFSLRLEKFPHWDLS